MTEQPSYFLPRDQRNVLTHVIETYPYPIALAYARLQDEMDRQQPVAAAWQMRDCWEVTIRFCATIALADAFAHPSDPELLSELASELVKWRGLSISSWHQLTLTAIEPLQPWLLDPMQEVPRRLVPELARVYYDIDPIGITVPTTVTNSIQKDKNSFVAWRNRVFGHGVFRNDAQWYAEETKNKLEGLHAFLTALQPIFETWQLVGKDENGAAVNWSGVGDDRPSTRHRHQMEGDPLPLLLESGADSLSLQPFLTIQKCSVCQQPAGFFFDRLKDKTKTELLEYDDGHETQRKNWEPVSAIQASLPAGYSFERQSYDSKESAEIDTIVFRDIEHDYVRPDYLLNALWRQIASTESGYLLVAGPEGTGKTFLVHGLEQDAARYEGVVIPYHIRQGATSVAQTFANEIHLQASDLRMRTTGPQFKGASIAEVRADFTNYMRTVAEANAEYKRIIVAIDALDELAGVEPEQVGIVDLLPNPADLPKGVFFVLTRREQLRPEVRAALLRVEGHAWRINLDPESEDNEDVIAAFVHKQLGEMDQESATLVPLGEQPAWVQAIVRQSGGVFLYANHLVRALEGGVFRNVGDLPAGDSFYATYLDRIRDRVGDQIFETVYLKTLLLLTASFTSVTVEQLVGWGVPRDRLTLAMYDLRDFIRYTRVPGFHESLSDSPEPRYLLAHESFRRYVEAEMAGALMETHREIAEKSMNRFGGDWSKADPKDDGDLYAILNIRSHLVESGSPARDRIDFNPNLLAFLIFNISIDANETHHYQIAVRGYDEAIGIWRALVDGGRTELRNDLARAVMNRASALQRQGDLAGAITGYDEAIAIRVEMESTLPPVVTEIARAVNARAYALHHLGETREAISALNGGLQRLSASSSDGAGQTYWLAMLTDSKAELVEALGDIEAAIQLRFEVERILVDLPEVSADAEELGANNRDMLARLRKERGNQDV